MKKIKVEYISNDETAIKKIFNSNEELNQRRKLFINEFTKYGFSINKNSFCEYSIHKDFIGLKRLFINTDLVDVEKIKNNNFMSEEDLHQIMFNAIDSLYTHNKYYFDRRAFKTLYVLVKNLRKDK